MRRPWKMALIAVGLAAIELPLSDGTWHAPVVRVCLGLVLVLLAPGALLHNVFLGREDTSLSGRLLGVLGLSMSAIIGAGAVLNIVTDIGGIGWLCAISIIALIRITMGEPVGDTGVDNTLSLPRPSVRIVAAAVGVAGLIAASFTVAIEAAERPQLPVVTQLWLLHPNVGRTYDIGAAMDRASTASYVIEVTINDRRRYTWMLRFEHAGSWSGTFTAPPNAVIKATLRRLGNQVPLRRVFILQGHAGRRLAG